MATVDRETMKALKRVYTQLEEQPLEPDDPRYIKLFEDPKLSPIDPVVRMRRCIEFAALRSSQLFSGHRGTGKSTQLRRLAHELGTNRDYKIVICDMEKYLPMSAEVEVVDFLLAAAGALSEALRDPELLGEGMLGGYWTRFVDWLDAQKISISELGISAKADVGGAEVGTSVKLNLKSDAVFRGRIRERMQLHVGAFREDVHEFVETCLLALRERHGNDTQLVIIYDSLEHLRGTTLNAGAVAGSLEQLFRGHGEALCFPYVHTIYTVPPWLRLQGTDIGNEPFSGYCQVPCVKVHERPSQPSQPSQPVAPIVPNREGLDVLWRVASARGDMTWLLGDRAAFDEIALASGGSLRDLFRILKPLTLDAVDHGVPVSAARRRLAIDELRAGYLGFTNKQAKWLHEIERSGTLDIANDDDQHTIARFLDTHVLLAYRNGSDWYGVHPVIREDVERRAAKADD